MQLIDLDGHNLGTPQAQQMGHRIYTPVAFFLWFHSHRFFHVFHSQIKFRPIIFERQNWDLGNLKGCWSGRVLKCNAQCYSVMKIGKRGVKNGMVDGGERIYWWGFWEILKVLWDLITR